MHLLDGSRLHEVHLWRFEWGLQESIHRLCLFCSPPENFPPFWIGRNPLIFLPCFKDDLTVKGDNTSWHPWFIGKGLRIGYNIEVRTLWSTASIHYLVAEQQLGILARPASQSSIHIRKSLCKAFLFMYLWWWLCILLYPWAFILLSMYILNV